MAALKLSGKRLELSAAAKAARKPLPPEDLINAKHDRVHKDPGQGRVARTKRRRQRANTEPQQLASEDSE